MSARHRLTASVVVPTYNRRERLDRLVDTVLGDPDADELVVVVDGCDDGSIEALDARAATESRLRPLFVENGGSAAARQAGAEAATGDVLVVLDDDVIPGPGLVGGHLGHHRERENQLVVGYMPTDVPSPRLPGQAATVLYAREYEAECEAWERDPESILTSLWAGNLSIRRSDALVIRMESPNGIIPYHQDQDFGFRCSDAGLTAVFDRSLRAKHEHRRTLDEFIADAKRQGEGSLLIHESRGTGPYPFSSERPFPFPVRHAIRVAARRLTAASSVAGLRAVTRMAGELGAFPAETYLAMVLRQVVQRQRILEILATRSEQE